MQVIEELLYQKTVQGLDWFFSVWWYWLPAGLGFLFRFWLLKYKILDAEMRIKAILRDIGIIFVLTILWGSMNSTGLDENTVVMIIILTLVYVFYGLIESCEDTGGTTESLLLIIKGVFVTMLSFQTIGGTLFGAALTCILSVLAYKFWFGVEKKTDLFEIIFLCIEAVGVSIYGEFHDIEGFAVFLFVFYEETALFLLNYLVKEGIAMFFDESDDY